MSNPNTWKTCVVPKCTTTTKNSPEKLFFIVPKDDKMRKKWIKAMNRLIPFGDKSTVYCCEDHFDIENDMENYIKYKLVGGRLKLKQGIVPHKFKCLQEEEVKPLIKHETSTLQKPEEIFVVEDPLSFGKNEECLEISKKSKGVRVNLKAKGVYKPTRTVKKCLKKKRKIISPGAVSFGSMNDTSSSASSHENLDQESKNPNEDSDSEPVCQTLFLETICNRRLFYPYLKNHNCS